MDERIEARIAGLEAEIATLKAMVAGEAETEVEPRPPTSDRRGMVTLLAASAVGAVAGAAIFNAQPAAALQGQSAILGVANDSTDTTQFAASNGVGVTAFGSSTGISSDGASGNALFPGSGPAPTSNFGIIGMSYVDAVCLVGLDSRWGRGVVAQAGRAEHRRAAAHPAGTSARLRLAPRAGTDSRRPESSRGRQRGADHRHHGQRQRCARRRQRGADQPDHHCAAGPGLCLCLGHGTVPPARRASTSPPCKTSPPPRSWAAAHPRRSRSFPTRSPTS